MAKKSNADLGLDADVRYGSDALLFCDWIDTTNFICIGGRGVAKSTVILARRSLRCVREMPGAPIAIVANTYSNLLDNIMPAVQNGWKLQGLIEGVHYVKGVRPPEEWRRRCSIVVLDYRHVYSFWNGSVIFLGSLDNPSLLAGKSVAHLLFDEAKYASDSRAARVMPILRGDAITYGRCHLYGGVTITTDMPDVTEGEYDWFFRYAAEMDPDRILYIVQAAGELNRLRIRLAKLDREADEAKVRRLEKKIEYYENGLLKLRKGQTFFVNISSLVNIDVLTVDYVKRLYNGALELHEFLKSVMGCRPGLRKDSRFYVLFGDNHKYYDGTATGVAAWTSADLVYLDPDRPLDAGMDFGGMMSMVVAQQDGAYYRIHKNFYEIPPAWLPQLADQFRTFFASHRNKTLHLYYDRAANSYHRQGKDLASDIKREIEHDGNGGRSGWNVVLMSRKQANIGQGEEYVFMQKLCEGKTRGLPTLKVDAMNCVEMISSIEHARTLIKYKGTVKEIHKDKRSEKLDPKKLPKLSTNFSDAFKYLMMRKEWRLMARPADGARGSGAAEAAEGWLADYLNKRR